MRGTIFLSIAMAVVVIEPVVFAEKRVEKVPITVVDVAGDQIYVEPGGDAGVRVGQQVKLGKRAYRVVSVNASAAILSLHKRIPAIGTRGTARVRAKEDRTEALPTPTPLASFEGQWRPAERPSSSQSPEPVHIAVTRGQQDTELQLATSVGLIAPISSDAPRVSHFRVRARLRAQPFGSLGIDADLEGGRWFGRSNDLGNGSRPQFQVNELRLRYGDRLRPALGVGRLRYAGGKVGMLDGVVARTDFGEHLSFYAFGGLVPDALDGRPSTDVARFGAGIAYSLPEHRLNPSAELSLHASNFDGSLDEQRANLSMRLQPGSFSLSLSSELSLFAADNQWGASRAELSMAALEIGFSKKRFRASLSATAQQPERSRWLASLLPASWLCSTRPDETGNEVCNGNRDYRYFALANASYLRQGYRLSAGASSVASAGATLDQVGAFIDATKELPLNMTLGLGMLASEAPFLRTWATRASLAHRLGELADLSLYYRPAVLLYDASSERIIEHRTGAETSWRLSSQLHLNIAAELLHTEEVGYFATFASLLWRSGL